MVCMLMFSGQQKELLQLKVTSKNIIAYLSEEMWEMNTFQNVNDLDLYLETKPLLDVVYLDITIDNSITIAEHIRRTNEKAIILLIADETISPIKYMKPSIMAASLLLRPIYEQQMQKTIKEILSLFVKNTLDDTEENSFWIDSREGKVKVPYNRISYFEAREKKIFLCLETKEYGFYETMNQLIETLPDYFIRCHRGYIVNTKKIEKVSLTNNEIELEDEIYIPISRSYRNAVKECVQK